MASQLDIFLTVFAGGHSQCLAFSDHNLRLHDINTGDLFGDRMFDLHTGVNLNKIKLVAVQIHQKLDGAGTFIADMSANLTSQITDLNALGVG